MAPVGYALMVLATQLLPSVAKAAASDEQTGPPMKSDIIVEAIRGDALLRPNATGSRLGLSMLATPASISSVDGDVIRSRGDLDIVSAVTRAAGVTTSANPGNGGTALAMRGFKGQGSILQLYDGIRLFPVAGTITFPIDPWNVERIEILSGPASVLYGQGALGGAVNVITRTPNPERTEFSGEAGYGSQQSWHIAVDVSGPLSRMFSYRIDASYRRSDGYVDRGDSSSLALSGALRFAPGSDFSLTLRNDYGNQRPMEYFGTPLIAGRLIEANRRRNYNVADAGLHYRDNRTTLTMDWRMADGISLSSAAYRMTSKRLFRNLEGYAYDNGTGLIDRFDNLGIVHDMVQTGNQTSIRIAKPLMGLQNDLVVGFEVNRITLLYSHDFGSDPQQDSVDPYRFDPGTFYDTQGVAPRYRTRTSEYSVFAEDRLAITGRLSLVAGVRYERDRVQRWNISQDAMGNLVESNAFPLGKADKILHDTTWRIGAVYQPTAALSFYGQYSTGVDPLGTLTTFSPNAAQFAFTNARGDQIEIGAKVSFLNGRGSATLAGYRIVKRGLVAQRTPASPIEQIGRQSSTGIETSVAMRVTGRLGIDANATILDARYDDFVSGGAIFSGNTPKNIPEAAANVTLYWRPADRLQTHASLRYAGPSWSDDANSFRVPGYAVVDAGLAHELAANLTAKLMIYNLFDRIYAATTYNDEQWILGRPRSIDVTVSARF